VITLLRRGQEDPAIATNSMEKLYLGEYLSRQLVVPTTQRGPVWTKEWVQNFLDTMLQSFLSGAEFDYLGDIKVVKHLHSGSLKYTLHEGLQRTLTLTFMFDCIEDLEYTEYPYSINPLKFMDCNCEYAYRTTKMCEDYSGNFSTLYQKFHVIRETVFRYFRKLDKSIDLKAFGKWLYSTPHIVVVYFPSDSTAIESINRENHRKRQELSHQVKTQGGFTQSLTDTIVKIENGLKYGLNKDKFLAAVGLIHTDAKMGKKSTKVFNENFLRSRPEPETVGLLEEYFRLWNKSPRAADIGGRYLAEVIAGILFAEKFLKGPQINSYVSRLRKLKEDLSRCTPVRRGILESIRKFRDKPTEQMFNLLRNEMDTLSKTKGR
jgi:hypothetical protein